jgi:hypothetical protein
MEKESLHKPRLRRGLLVGCILLLTCAVFGSALLTLFIVPAPDAQTAVEVSGLVQYVSPPNPQYGDLAITLADGRTFYVNRAAEVDYFHWQRLLQEVDPGDMITLTVVRPLAWRLLGRNQPPTYGPLAGVRTETNVFMDPAVPAVTWTAHSSAVRNTVFLLATLVVLVILSRQMLHP